MGSNKPGVLIYFDIMGVVDKLSDQDAGILFRAILRYARDREVIELPDRLVVLWPLVQCRLDYDDERYLNTAFKRKYGAYVRWCRQKGQPCKSYADWLVTESVKDEENDLAVFNAPDAYA